MNLKDLKIKESKEKTCKGLFFRAKLNMFINKKGEYVCQERMIPVKRISCKGCECCAPLLEELWEFACEVDRPVIQKFEHNALYELKITNVFTDWETGYAEDWDLEFVMVEEEVKNGKDRNAKR